PPAPRGTCRGRIPRGRARRPASARAGPPGGPRRPGLVCRGLLVRGSPPGPGPAPAATVVEAALPGLRGGEGDRSSHPPEAAERGAFNMVTPPNGADEGPPFLASPGSPRATASATLPGP